MIAELIAVFVIIFIFLIGGLIFTWTFATALILAMLFAAEVFYVIFMFIQKLKLKKLQEGYNEEEDTSRPTGREDNFTRGSSVTQKSIGSTEPNVSIEGRQLLQDVASKPIGETEQVNRKPKRSLRRIFKPRRRRG